MVYINSCFGFNILIYVGLKIRGDNGEIKH